ncbi:hypothetical protein [Pradoshia sp.]|uniref:hypothetical protein n=1 Tax=Pradoshia sp. TaxID=2651281 RepID=UPI003F0C7214
MKNLDSSLLIKIILLLVIAIIIFKLVNVLLNLILAAAFVFILIASIREYQKRKG